MAEAIGLAAVLDDKQFQEGLKRYQSGIAKAESATTQGAQSMSLKWDENSKRWRNALGHFATNSEIAAAGVKKVETQSAALAKSSASVSSSSGAAAAALARLGKQAADTHGSFSTASKSISGFGIAAATAFGTMLGNAIPQVLGALKSNILDAGMSFNALMEQNEIAFTTILGNGDKAKVLLDDLAKFAAATPFEFPELVDASKKLLAFGFSAKDIIPTMTRLGDVSAGLGIPVSELADLYGKARVQGRLFAEDINQLTGRGIPITAELAKQFGVSEDKVRGLVEAGKVGFPQLEKAFISMTSKGGKFGGLMEKQSKSFSGMLSTLKDNFKAIIAQLSKPAFEFASKWLARLIDYVSAPAFSKAVRDLADKFESFLFVVDSILELVSGKAIVIEDFAADLASLANQFGLDGIAVEKFANQFLRWIQQIGDAWRKGGIGGIAAQLANDLKAAWPQIQAQLALWGAQFWNWLTGPGGALEQAVTKISEVAKVIADWLAVKWENTIAPALGKWANDFWVWLTGDNGVLAAVSEQMTKLTDKIRDWSRDPQTQKQLQQYGETIARGVLDGIGNLFSDTGESENAFRLLINSMWQATNNLRESFAEIGASIASGMVREIANRLGFDPNTAQQIADGFKNLFESAFNLFFSPGGPIVNIIRNAIQRFVDLWNSIMKEFNFHMPWDDLKPPTGGGGGGQPNDQYASGGWVRRSAMALVHAGEYVIPARPMARRGAGGPIQIVNNWPDSIAQTDRFAFEQIAETAAYRALTRVMQEAPA